MDDVSHLLHAWTGGDGNALEDLIPIVYRELRHVAHDYLRSESSGHRLQTTALVHEAYLRLDDCKRLQWQNRAHFYALSGRLVRPILVENARRYNPKRGGDVQHISADEAAVLDGNRSRDLLALDDALNALGRVDPRKVQVVEMRCFGGLSMEETAEVFNVSPITVRRDWGAARIWLYRELTGGADHGHRTLEATR